MSEKSKSTSSTAADPNVNESSIEGDEVKVHEAISSLRALVLGEINVMLLVIFV
jgi:hypothetical protein